MLLFFKKSWVIFFFKIISPFVLLLNSVSKSETFENFHILLLVLNTAVGLAEMVLCQMFQRICSCIRSHPLVSVESCAVKRPWLQIRLKGGFGMCLEMGRQPFSFEVVYTQNKELCAWPCHSPGVLYHLFLRQKSGGRLEKREKKRRSIK